MQIPIYSPDEIRAAFGRGEYYAIVGMVQRPGFLVFMQDLELSYYPPYEPTLNDQFNIYHSEWKGVFYCVIMIPRRDQMKAHEVAMRHGMNLADTPSLCILSSSQGVEQSVFPLQGSHVVHCLYEKDSPYYRGISPAEAALAQKSKIDELVAAYEKRARELGKEP